ncbi:hypothetical protein ACQ4M4_21005 [Leptolyngbya sp. AN02str]|uniref:hypothetical protein n=1 Tax=Leptolyngbya sp. AN02str TaxID=3423363 RepID=UPI003D311A78
MTFVTAMSSAEFEAALKAAIDECDAVGCPLSGQQQAILMRAIANPLAPSSSSEENPLDNLPPEQRQALIDFIAEQEQQSRNWKVQLLNDWLAGRESGKVQFIRDEYGLQWLERVRPSHVVRYARPTRLVVGDRIEVSNGLWEWVQDDGPCSREWFLCTVISVSSPNGGSTSPTDLPTGHTNCIIRFDNGMEYEIQGIYEWNRYNWRWAETE